MKGLPALMAHLPIHNGFPVPYFTAYVNGQPDPRVADARKARTCARRRICWVCGLPLPAVVTFIGGPLSCCSHVFTDGPMHEECSTFALQVCPYLATVRRDRTADESQLAPDPHATMEKPVKFGQMFCGGFTANLRNEQPYFHPVASSILRVHWWVAGKVVP